MRCFLTGDEYYHRLHDAKGYTIVQNPETGYWVYADTVHWRAENGERRTESEERRADKGELRWDLVATRYVAGSVDPATLGISPNLGVDRETWRQLQHRYDVPKEMGNDEENGLSDDSRQRNAAKTSGRNHGTLNNIVIFVRFSDDAEISTPFTTIDAMFNDSSANAVSMYNYFKHASYNKIFIPTYYYPVPNGNNIISYQDSMPRSYYMPYNAVTTPNGYQDENERRNREFGLLERAVNYINDYHPISTSIELDMDNDGFVDNICFVVKGTFTGWNDLLWPHKWSLYDRYVYINGKRVFTFNLQLEGSGEHYFSSSTFCHEMFHTLGAPDLYHYYNYTDVSGVGSWDLMCNNTNPPQHMSAYMKWKYGNWLDMIPEITIPGTYTLHSLADSGYSNCAYKIAAQEPNQWYILEYRDNTELFETALPGKGLIIFRIDERFEGNADFDGNDYFDEVYLFRPYANNDTTNGEPAQAFFRYGSGRTAFTPSTNPRPWLSGNVIDTTFAIINVGVADTTISFTYVDMRGCRTPENIMTTSIGGTEATLSWTGNAPTYRLSWRMEGETTSNSILVNGTSHTLTDLALNSSYEWKVRALCSSNDSSEETSWIPFHTLECNTPDEITIDEGDASSYRVPINTNRNYSYSQMIYTPEEIGGGITITKLSFNYIGSNSITNKNSCIVYLGHSANSGFTSNSTSQFVPVSQMTKVYEGDFNFSSGWNTIELDTFFHYDGVQNLVVAVDDNSGDCHSTTYQFSCTRTLTRYSSLTIYDDYNNFDPSAPVASGSKMRYTYHPDIRFEGCPATGTNHYSVVINRNNPAYGTVSGNGVYEEGDTATITAAANEHCHFSHWQFQNGEVTTENPYSFVVDSTTIITAHFIADSLSIEVASEGDGQVEGDGRFIYGTTHYINATAEEHNQFVHWRCNNSGETYSEPTLQFTVTSDSSFTAVFARDKHRVLLASSNPDWGVAWFTVEGRDERLTSDSVEYGRQIVMEAESFGDERHIYSFDRWSDGSTLNPRTMTVYGDMAYTAYFVRRPRPVGIEGIEDEGVVITVRDGQLNIAGAEGREIRIYDVTGRRHEQGQLAHGVYIIKVEGMKPRKLVVR